MIAKAIKGVGFRGTLEYVARGGPRIGGNMAGQTPRELAAEFGHVRALRPNLKAAVLHLPVRPAPGESLTDQEWNAVAERMLVSLGYEDVPYVIYRHGGDADQHVHIVASRVTYGGQSVSTSNDYYRAMAALRSIERDLGLRVVPYRQDAARRPSQAEHQLVERTTRPSRRSELQEHIQEAAAGRPSVTVFFERLQCAGVEVVPNLSTTGHVTGLSYRFGDLLAKGSGLGRPYTWRGVLHHLGVDYDAARDLPALLAAKARGLGRDPQPTTSLPSSLDISGPVEEEVAPAAVDLSLLQLRRHLRALGAERYDVLALDLGKGRQELRTDWTPEQIERALGWLRRENAQGCEILIRPRSRTLVLLTEVPEAGLRTAKERGLAPAAAVDIGRGSYELWLRHGVDLAEQETAVLRPLLARALDLSPERSPAPWGHLAGFTARLAGAGAPPPYVRLREHRGTPYPRAEELLGRARSHIEDVHRQREVEREIRQQDNLTRAHGALDDPARASVEAGLVVRPMAPADVTRESARRGLERVGRAEIAHARAIEELGRSSPEDFPARYEAAIATYRQLSGARQELEELAGHQPLPTLDPGDFERYVELRGRLLRCEERLLTSTGVERAAAAISHRVAAREVRLFATSRDLAGVSPDALARRALSEPTGRLERVYRAAAHEVERTVSSLPPSPSPEDVRGLQAALAHRLAAELRLEGHRVDLHRALRSLASEREMLLVRLIDVERLPAGEQQVLWQRLGRVEARMGVLDRAATRASRDAVARATVQLEERLLVAPTYTNLRAYTEALTSLHRWEDRVKGQLLPARPLARGERATPWSLGLRQSVSMDAESLRAEVSRAAAGLLARPAPETFAAYRAALTRHVEATTCHRAEVAWREHRSAQHELGRVLRDTSRVVPEAGVREASRCHALLDRSQAAQRQLLHHLPPPPPPAVRPGGEMQRFQTLARRLREDDTPELVAALLRESTSAIVRLRGFTPPRVPVSKPPSTLAEAAPEYRRARAELLLAGRSVSHEVSLPNLERLRHALARFQARGEQLRSAVAVRPTPTSLRPEHFLRHPRFAGSPDRAAAAWAAYAARRGAPEHAIAAGLSRFPRAQRALPGLASLRDSSFVAGLAVLWAARIARRLVRERVHTP